MGFISPHVRGTGTGEQPFVKGHENKGGSNRRDFSRKYIKALIPIINKENIQKVHTGCHWLISSVSVNKMRSVSGTEKWPYL